MTPFPFPPVFPSMPCPIRPPWGCLTPGRPVTRSVSSPPSRKSTLCPTASRRPRRRWGGKWHNHGPAVFSGSVCASTPIHIQKHSHKHTHTQTNTHTPLPALLLVVSVVYERWGLNKCSYYLNFVFYHSSETNTDFFLFYRFGFHNQNIILWGFVLK